MPRDVKRRQTTKTMPATASNMQKGRHQQSHHLPSPQTEAVRELYVPLMPVMRSQRVQQALDRVDRPATGTSVSNFAPNSDDARKSTLAEFAPNSATGNAAALPGPNYQIHHPRPSHQS